MALALRLLLAALLLAPAATACSLAYQPFGQPSWDGALHYVDGFRLRRVEGGAATVAAEGFFLSYGTSDDLLLVAGQEGLGADCSGTGWLRLLRGNEVLWEKAGPGRVWNDPDGPIAQHGGFLWRLRGTELVRLSVPSPQGVYIEGWTPQADPVYRGSASIVVGAVEIPRPEASGTATHVARNHAATAVSFTDGARVVLAEVAGGSGRAISWPAQAHSGGLAWAEGWYVLQGGRVYLVRDGVVDLGVEGAVSVGSRGGRALVFSETRYTVFDGTRPVEAAWLKEGVWSPFPPGADQSRPIAGAAWGSLELRPAPPPKAGGGGPTLDLPASGLALALACLALASRRRPA